MIFWPLEIRGGIDVFSASNDKTSFLSTLESNIITSIHDRRLKIAGFVQFFELNQKNNKSLSCDKNWKFCRRVK